MANVDRPNGLKLVGHISGSPFNAQIKLMAIAAGNSDVMFVGDLVKLEGGADTFGRPTIAQQSAGSNASVGVILDFEYDPTDLSSVHRPTLTARLAYVCVDPEAIYEIQDDATAVLSAADVSMNANILVGSGNTTTGASAMELLASTVATTAAFPLKILNLINRDNNAFGNNARWHVKINNHQYASGTGVAGVS